MTGKIKDKARLVHRHQDGFTLVELMVTMVIFVLVIAAASQIFVNMLTQFKQQSRIAESNIQGIAGLEMMKRDVEQAGYGLPLNVDADANRLADPNWLQLGRYCEAQSFAVVPNPASFNDGVTKTSAACDAADSGGNAPRAFVAGDDVGLNAADYLVVKATNVSTSPAANKWAYISNTAAGNVSMTATGSAVEDLASNERVIVVLPSAGTAQRILMTNAGAYITQITANAQVPPNFTQLISLGAFPDNLEPNPDTFVTHVVYGIDSNTNPRMPFNRADYYVVNANVPSRCAPTAGVLVKSVLNQSDGVRGGGLPLLDCVVDMQVTFSLDIDANGTADTIANADGSAVSGTGSVADAQATLASAALLRDRLKQIRVYILSHEGQRDTAFTFTGFTGTATCATCITVGNANVGDTAALTKDYDLSAINNYLNYRWKIYQMIVTPQNLR